MKQTQFISLTFLAGQSTSSKSISVPFKVKKITTKNMSLDTGDFLVAGRYVTLESDLVSNQSMGSCFNNSAYASNTIQNVECLLWNPQIIQGVYNFTLKQSNGSLYPASTGNDAVGLIVEFSSEDED